jgi:hypothetical protein
MFCYSLVYLFCKGFPYTYHENLKLCEINANKKQLNIPIIAFFSCLLNKSFNIVTNSHIPSQQWEAELGYVTSIAVATQGKYHVGQKSTE